MDDQSFQTEAVIGIL